MNGNTYFGDKEMLEDLLLSEKHLSRSYNDHIPEVACQTLRDILEDILRDTHQIQQAIRKAMVKRGWYKVKNATSQEIEMAKQKFDQLSSELE